MKGIVFTEFMRMVVQSHDEDMLDEVIEASGAPTQGAYTAVGTYDHKELVALVMALSNKTGIPVHDLIFAFGKYLFPRFAELYPRFFTHHTDALRFLAGIEEVIHAEVRKLYPDAELPRFEADLHGDRELHLVYESKHHFADLAHGLIVGCCEHFGQNFDISRKAEIGVTDGSRVRFVLTRTP